MKLSVVIPTWNEAGNLQATLDALPRSAEVVVVDGGSTDATLKITRRSAAHVISCPRGRARQMHDSRVRVHVHAVSFNARDAHRERPERAGAQERQETCRVRATHRRLPPTSR